MALHRTLARALALLVLCALLLTLTSCISAANQANTDSSVQEEAMELTKESIIAHTDLTEEDFEGVDFDAFVAYFNLTPERLAEYDPVMLLNLYKEAMAQETTRDYTGILEKAGGTLSPEDLDQVSVLIWEYHSGNANSSMVIDRESGAVYYGDGSFLSAVGESKRIADFSEEDAAFLCEALAESGITEWENEYLGSNEGTTGLYEWTIALQLADGRCICYHGSGVRDSGTPKTMEPLLNALVEHFQGKQAE